MNLNGRVAMITGGAGHIGGAAADALAELGAKVVLLDTPDTSGADKAADLGRAHGVTSMFLPVDLADETAVRTVPDSVREAFGRLDILVNCAALGGTTPLKGWVTSLVEQSAETWRRALEINLTMPFVLTQICSDMLRESGHGSVINVSSIYGVVGPDMRLYENTKMGNPAAYGASKGGLLQLTRWLATVLAPTVRVNALSPGGVWRNQPDSFRDRYESRTPLQRMATEEDMKGAVAYLASDLSAYVTGQNLIVDGGWTVW